MIKRKTKFFALCVENEESEDLELRKIYEILPDKQAGKDGYLRVIDDSGEDYLYPKTYFVHVRLPRKAHEILTHDH